MKEILEQGGPIVYLLLGINVFGLATIFLKGMDFRSAKKTHEYWLKQAFEEMSKRIDSLNLAQLSELAREEISYYLYPLEKNLSSLRIIAIVAPLLGLLGTVWGIFISFKNLSVNGLGDPAILADGISKALITTAAGLIVAIIHHVGHHLFNSTLNNWELVLEKQLVSMLRKKV